MKSKKTRVIVWAAVGFLVIIVGVVSYLIWSGKISTFAMGPGGPSGTPVSGRISMAANCNEIKYVDPPDAPASSNYNVVAENLANGNESSHPVKRDKTFAFRLPEGEYSLKVDSTCRINDDYGKRTITGCQRDAPGVKITVGSRPVTNVVIGDVKDPRAVVMISVIDSVTKSRVPNISIKGSEPCGSFSGNTGNYAAVVTALACIGKVSVDTVATDRYYSGHGEVTLTDENVCQHKGLPVEIRRK